MKVPCGRCARARVNRYLKRNSEHPVEMDLAESRLECRLAKITRPHRSNFVTRFRGTVRNEFFELGFLPTILAYATLIESLAVQGLTFIGGSWATIAHYLPAGLTQSLSALGNRVPVDAPAADDANMLQPAQAAIMVAVYTLAFVALVVFAFRRQDSRKLGCPGCPWRASKECRRFTRELGSAGTDTH